MCLLFVLQGCHHWLHWSCGRMWSKSCQLPGDVPFHGARLSVIPPPRGIPRSRYCSWVPRHPLHLVLLRLHCHVPCRVLRRETPECISHWIDQFNARVFTVWALTLVSHCVAGASRRCWGRELEVCWWDQFLHKRKQFRWFTWRTHSSTHWAILMGGHYSGTQLNYIIMRYR
jgi:hypothetical protein